MIVKVYSRAHKPYSKMLRNALKYNNVEFENYDIKYPKNKAKMLNKTGRQNQTPVLGVDGKKFVGFDREK